MAFTEKPVEGPNMVLNGLSNHGPNVTEGAFPSKLDTKDHTSSTGSDPEKDGHERRRSSVAGPALEVLQNIQTTDKHHPMHWSSLKKWVIVTIYCVLQVFVTFTSTSYISIEFLIAEQYDVESTQVLALGQSMFIVGTAIGPAFLGPLSDIGGRKWVYVVSMILYAILNIGCALATNFAMLVVFMFLIGVVGSVALCNVAGTIADLFGDNDNAGQPMAMFVASANWGPSWGSPIGEWIAENEWMADHGSWAWVFYINIIIAVAYAIAMCFIPETLPRMVIAKAAKEDPTNANENEIAIMQDKVNILQEIRFISTMALRLMIFEPIITFLAIYNGFAYGLLFLYLDGVFEVFSVNNGLSYLAADLTFLNFAVGMCHPSSSPEFLLTLVVPAVTIMFCFVPVQTYLFKRDRLRNGGTGRPEARFLTSLVFVWGFPISLLWFAFTSTGNVSYWSPVIAGGLLGFCDPLLWLSMLNYITDTYPNVAASAIAAFLIPSFLIAAAFTHIGIIMFENLSSQWAMATLGFVSLTLVALIYFVYFWGPWLRRKSKLARTF